MKKLKPMKKYKFVYLDVEENKYYFANKRPKEVNQYDVRRYCPRNFFYHHIEDQHTRMKRGWTEYDLSRWLIMHLESRIKMMKSEDRTLKLRIKNNENVSRSFLDEKYQQEYFANRKNVMKQAKANIEYWSKRNEEIKSTPEFMMEMLLK
jgi:hypothetical protein